MKTKEELEVKIAELTKTLEMVEDVLQRCDAIYPNSIVIRNEIRAVLGRDILEEEIFKRPVEASIERKQVFFKNANREKRNFELHKSLIEKHLCDRENKQYSEDLKAFAEKQVVDGNLLLSLIEYAEEYCRVKYGEEPLGEIFGVKIEPITENTCQNKCTRCKTMEIMIDNGLGWDDIKNDISYPRS